ncbi:UPF0052-domain-containing protein [Diplocarpon rosae]|nr:UPF0052-domain-containing protein [Diplocarpon rosae]
MSKHHIVVFSGGSAANNLVDVFGKVAADKGCSLSYIIPISDNGGSSSELIRVFGGPGIGDVRTSVGNLFLTGARLFTGSFESAVYLLGAITGVPSNVQVIPAINSNFSHHISAGLQDGTQITGQNSISHPSAPSAPPPIPTLSPTSTPSGHSQEEENDPTSRTTFHQRALSRELSEHDFIEDANLPGSLPTLRRQYISFAKEQTEDLPSRIERIWYINPYGQEIRPAANPKVLSSIDDASAVIYSIGSLYTSIIPCLVLRDVGAKIAAAGHARCKILVLNGSLDRETRAGGRDFTARDFVRAIADACASSRGEGAVGEAGWREYVTHVIHLQGEGAPRVEKEELASAGVECVRIYGRKKEGEGAGMLYDGTALGQALEAIIGAGKRSAGVSRRNTLGVSNAGVV